MSFLSSLKERPWRQEREGHAWPSRDGADETARTQQCCPPFAQGQVQGWPAKLLRKASALELMACGVATVQFRLTPFCPCSSRADKHGGENRWSWLTSASGQFVTPLRTLPPSHPFQSQNFLLCVLYPAPNPSTGFWASGTKCILWQDMVVRTCDASTQEAKRRGCKCEASQGYTVVLFLKSTL